MPHRTAGCGKSSLRPLMAGSSPSLPDGSSPSAAMVRSASDVQCSRLLKTTMEVVAEGVETPDCLAMVAAGGLRHGAGFPVRRADAGGGLRRLRQPMENTTMNANEPSTSCCVCCKGNPARCRLHAGRGRVRGAFLRAGVLSALPGAGQHCDRNQRQTGRL